MKKIFVIFTVLTILAGCPTSENNEKEPEIKTTLTIKNQSFSDLVDVKWDNDFFADKENNTLSISSSVKKNVSAGDGYIYFSRKQNPVIARTKDIVSIEQGQGVSFIFMDNTLIVEASNPDNTGSLKDLISRLLTPSKPVLTAKDGAIEASWQTIEGATSYRVYIAETETAPAEAAKTVTGTNTTITGLANEKNYYVWVQAVSARSESELSPAAQKMLSLSITKSPVLTAGDGSISVKWDAVDMAASYKVYISTTTTPPKEAEKIVTVTNTAFTGLSNDITYYVWVQAVNAGGPGLLSERAQIALTLAAPVAPTLTAGNGSIAASWNAVSTAASYKVYFSTTTTRPTDASQTATTTTAIFTGLTNGTTYHIWVQAVNNGGPGTISERASLLLPVLATPQSVSLSGWDGSITVSWNSVNLASSYKVYFSTSTTRPTGANRTVTINSTTFSGLTNGTTYYVWVQAVNNGGESAVSAPANLQLFLPAPQISYANVYKDGNIYIINLSWTYYLDLTYKVYYSTSTTPPADAAFIIAPYTFDGTLVLNDTARGTYYFWVQAVGVSGSSAMSPRVQLSW